MKVSLALFVLLAGCAVALAVENAPVTALTDLPVEQNREKRHLGLGLGLGAIGLLGAAGLIGAKAGLVGGALAGGVVGGAVARGRSYGGYGGYGGGYYEPGYVRSYPVYNTYNTYGGYGAGYGGYSVYSPYPYAGGYGGYY